MEPGARRVGRSALPVGYGRLEPFTGVGHGFVDSGKAQKQANEQQQEGKEDWRTSMQMQMCFVFPMTMFLIPFCPCPQTTSQGTTPFFYITITGRQ